MPKGRVVEKYSRLIYCDIIVLIKTRAFDGFDWMFVDGRPICNFFFCVLKERARVDGAFNVLP